MRRVGTILIRARRSSACALILLSITAARAGDKDESHFAAKAASTYPNHQTQEKITLAAAPYVTAEQASSAFGKVNPYAHGILPVLLVIENGTGKTIRVDLKAEWQDLNRHTIDAMPPGDVVLFNGVRKAPGIPNSSPIPHRKAKGPLHTWEIEGRAFSAKLIPPGETASGFIYFESDFQPGSHLVVSGLKDAATGQDYFFFEIPLEK
jgi:hypothetical protein